jgi:integrase
MLEQQEQQHQQLKKHSQLQPRDPLQKWKDRDLMKVYNFLNRIKSRSNQTMEIYQFGLEHFERFLIQQNNNNSKEHNIETVFGLLTSGKLDVYELLDQFVAYLQSTAVSNGRLSARSIKIYVSAVRSYLQFYDIDIIQSKFKRKVKMPSMNRQDEEPIDATDIRQILLACNNRRLKAYLLVLASGGMRAIEALAIRLRDIDDSVEPTKVHIRKEYAKTRVGRDIYISNEATHYLKQWIDFKYRDKHKEDSNLRNRIKHPDDLVFAIKTESTDPNAMYIKVLLEFEKVLDVSGLNGRKEDGGANYRRRITFHSFRRHAKSVISDQASSDFSEYILGHSNKSVYYTVKEPARREFYARECMKYLTFLDYTTLEATGKNIESKLSEREKEIELLKQRDSMNTDAIASLSDKLGSVMQRLKELENKK